jgi:hypothetical protein
MVEVPYQSLDAGQRKDVVDKKNKSSFSSLRRVASFSKAKGKGLFESSRVGDPARVSPGDASPACTRRKAFTSFIIITCKVASNICCPCHFRVRTVLENSQKREVSRPMSDGASPILNDSNERRKRPRDPGAL